MAEATKRKRFVHVEYDIPAPDLTEEEDLYCFSDDLVVVISDIIHDMKPTPEQAAKIFEYLKIGMREKELFADTDFREFSENEKKV